MLMQCKYLAESPPQERLCGQCSSYLNVCLSTRCSVDGLLLGIDCELYMCELCSCDCIQNK